MQINASKSSNANSHILDDKQDNYHNSSSDDILVLCTQEDDYEILNSSDPTNTQSQPSQIPETQLPNKEIKPLRIKTFC